MPISRDGTTPEILAGLSDDHLTNFVSLGADELSKRGLPLPESLALRRTVVVECNFSDENLINPLSDPESMPNSFLADGRVAVDHAARRLEVDGETHWLSTTPFNTLSILAANAGQVITHSFMLQAGWEEKVRSNRHDKVKIALHHVRRALGKDLGHPSQGAIQTLNGIGWVALPSLINKPDAPAPTAK